MKLLREALALASVLLLAVGYAASQWFMSQSRQAEYVQVLAKTPIATVSLVIVIAAVISAFIPEREEGSE